VEAAYEAPSGALDVVGEGFQRESRVWARSDGALDAVWEAFQRATPVWDRSDSALDAVLDTPNQGVKLLADTSC